MMLFRLTWWIIEILGRIIDFFGNLIQLFDKFMIFRYLIGALRGLVAPLRSFIEFSWGLVLLLCRRFIQLSGVFALMLVLGRLIKISWMLRGLVARFCYVLGQLIQVSRLFRRFVACVEVWRLVEVGRIVGWQVAGVPGMEIYEL